MKSRTPSKPDPLQRINSLLSSLDATQRKVLLAWLIFIFLLGFTTLLLAYYTYEPEITSFFAPPTPNLTPTPTPVCNGSTLQLGTKTIHFESITRLADGSINVPAGTSGVAYWIENLNNNYVFALSSSPDNLTLINALQSGEEASITWKNCNSATYILSAPQNGVPGPEILTDQAKVGIIVYVPKNALTSSVWVQGGLVGETITSPATYEPAPSEVNAEISLLEKTISADKQTIQVSISILNYGSAPITLSASDILFTPEGAAALALIQSKPVLPQEIKAGESKTFTLDFPCPASAKAALKIFTIEYDLEDY